MSGYEVGHYPIKYHSASLNLKIKVTGRREKPRQRPVAFLAPLHVYDSTSGVIIPTPFIPVSTRANCIMACVSRFGRYMMVPQTAPDYLEFCTHMLEMYFEPITEVHTLKDWLLQTNYTLKEREMISDSVKELQDLTEEDFDNKSFIKWECYTQPKCPRAINSLQVTMKAIFGPLMHSISLKMKKIHWFVKGWNPRDWPDLMFKLFGMNPVMESDFSSAEAHFEGVYLDVLVRWFNHMTSKVHINKLLREAIIHAMHRRNKCRFGNITARINDRLMSGSMWTSMANGVFNLTVMSYLTLRSSNFQAMPYDLAKSAREKFIALIEGDDGITLKVPISAPLVQIMGLNLEMKPAPNFGMAKFCGVVCDPLTRVVVVNPIDVIRKFFWLPMQYRYSKPGIIKGLLRAKTMSYNYLYAGAPVIGELTQWLLHETRSYTPIFDRNILPYSLNDMKLNPSTLCRKKTEVDIRSRILVQQKYGVSVELQYQIEKSFSGNSPGLPLLHLMTETDVRHFIDFVHSAMPRYPCYPKTVGMYMK